jgi:hypothetical protein
MPDVKPRPRRDLAQALPCPLRNRKEHAHVVRHKWRLTDRYTSRPGTSHALGHAHARGRIRSASASLNATFGRKLATPAVVAHPAAASRPAPKSTPRPQGPSSPRVRRLPGPLSSRLEPTSPTSPTADRPTSKSRRSIKRAQLSRRTCVEAAATSAEGTRRPPSPASDTDCTAAYMPLSRHSPKARPAVLALSPRRGAPETRLQASRLRNSSSMRALAARACFCCLRRARFDLRVV